MKKIKIIIVLFLLVYNNAYTQYFRWGNEPNLKWKERSNERLKLITPEVFSADSLFVAYFDSAIFYQAASLHANTRKLNIVLHPNTLVPNGFVAWAPARSELFTAPPRDFYPGFWPQQLAWHEMRHFAQFSVAENQLKRRVLGSLFGQYLTAAYVGLTAPAWYIEGDATASETAFLETGRGRSPSFSTPYFAWLVNQKYIPNYNRFVMGSDKDYTPNRYLYGYWMIACGQSKYGRVFWPNVFAHSFMKSNFGKFPRAFKQFSPDDIPLRHFSDSTQYWVLKSVENELESLILINSNKITDSKEYCNYRPIGCDSEGNIIAFKNSFHGEPCFVSIQNNKQEKIIKYTNYIHDESFGFDGKHIFYSEYRPHQRWEMVDFSKTLCLDINNKKIKNKSVTYKELLPALSPNGKILVTCAYLNDGTYHVNVTDIENSQTIGWAKFDYAEQPVSMAIDNSGTNLFLIQQTISQRRIVKFNASSKSIQVLLSSTNENFNHLVLIDNFLYFSSTLNGNEEIWRIHVDGGEPQCITNTKFGAAFPVSDGQSGLLFSEMTEKGSQIRYIENINPIDTIKRWKFMYESADLLSYNAKKIKDNINFDKITVPESKPYRKLKNIINVHSWGPLTIDPSSGTVNPGIQFDSQNILSTLSASIFSGVNLATATIESGIRTSYSGLYPIISIGYTNYSPVFNNKSGASYNSLEFSGYIPLTYTKNAWIFKITPRIEIRPWSVADTGDGMLSFARHAGLLSLSAYKKTNEKNIYPKLGIFSGNGILWQNYDSHKGLLRAGTGGVWLPGAFRHDGFRIRTGYELRDTLAFPFNTMMSAPRSYNLLKHPIKYFFSGEYACPLLYTDFYIGSLIYLKKLSGMISYDYALSPENKNFSSFGIHLMGDVNFLRLYAPLRLVFSEYYLQPTNKWQFQFGLSYDLYAY
jgi:hypothetical protein